MQNKIINTVGRLKKYFSFIFTHKEVPRAKLLSTNESLKRFSHLWKYSGEDVMTMIALIEYEYISENNYTEEQIAAIKTVLGKVIKFIKDCDNEWEEYEKSINIK